MCHPVPQCLGVELGAKGDSLSVKDGQPSEVMGRGRATLPIPTPTTLRLQIRDPRTSQSLMGACSPMEPPLLCLIIIFPVAPASPWSGFRIRKGGNPQEPSHHHGSLHSVPWVLREGAAYSSSLFATLLLFEKG